MVVLTHGHADHIGGTLTADGEPAFPNARYLMARAEWEFWTDDPDLSALRLDDALKDLLRAAVRANLVPLEDRIDLLDSTGPTEVVPGITLEPAPGHTPGHLVVDVRSAGEQLLHLADTFLLPLNVAHPDWTAVVDLDPEQTVETRTRLFGQASEEGALAFAFHAPAPGLGHIVETGDGWKWEPI